MEQREALTGKVVGPTSQSEEAGDGAAGGAIRSLLFVGLGFCGSLLYIGINIGCK
jgi:hypothetical protein